MSGTFAREREQAGATQVSDTQASGSFKMAYYSKSLRYDSTCTKWYRSGSIMMDDYNGNLLEIRYLCTSAELYVNGAKSDWYNF